jgi:hypothetical protein
VDGWFQARRITPVLILTVNFVHQQFKEAISTAYVVYESEEVLQIRKDIGLEGREGGHSLFQNVHIEGLRRFNPLNAELNPICQLLILLGDLTFMGTCIVSIFQYIYPTRCNVTQFIYIWKPPPPTAHSNRFQLFHDSGR